MIVGENLIYLDEPDLDYIPSTKGDAVRKFERVMAEYLGIKDCVATNSGTSALHLALLACGIGKGDTVVVPATTFVATANAVLYTGAKVKLADVDINHWCLGSGTYKKADSILPVSLYGIAAGFSPGYAPIVVDTAESIHIKPDSPHHYFCYSFNGNKTITTGAGGLVVGPNLEKIRKLIRPAYSNTLAYNYGMAAENARLGLKQIIKLNDYINRKKEINAIYREQLYFLKFQGDQPFPAWMTACLLPEHIDIPTFQLRLEMRGIPTRRIFKPLNHYKHLADGKTYPNAERLYGQGLCLPSSIKNKDEDIYEVCKTIKDLI